MKKILSALFTFLFLGIVVPPASAADESCQSTTGREQERCLTKAARQSRRSAHLRNQVLTERRINNSKNVQGQDYRSRSLSRSDARRYGKEAPPKRANREGLSRRAINALGAARRECVRSPVANAARLRCIERKTGQE